MKLLLEISISIEQASLLLQAANTEAERIKKQQQQQQRANQLAAETKAETWALRQLAHFGPFTFIVVNWSSLSSSCCSSSFSLLLLRLPTLMSFVCVRKFSLLSARSQPADKNKQGRSKSSTQVARWQQQQQTANEFKAPALFERRKKEVGKRLIKRHKSTAAAAASTCRRPTNWASNSSSS